MKLSNFISQIIGDKLVSFEFKNNLNNRSKVYGLVMKCTSVFQTASMESHTDLTIQKQNGSTQNIYIGNIIDGTLKIHSENERIIFKISNNI